jgi:CRP/FNR family transcriptional regulator, cyclic AMP receptor protein
VPVDPRRLSDVPLFAGLSPDERERVASWLEARHAHPDERICGEGSPGYSFFVIERGTARVTSAGGAERTLGPGDFFGEIALVGDGRRTATVTAGSPLDFFALWGGDFRLLEREQPSVAESIRRAVADRLAGLEA